MNGVIRIEMRDDRERGIDEIVENGNVHHESLVVIGLEADQDLDHQGEEDLTMTVSLIAIKLLFIYFC